MPHRWFPAMTAPGGISNGLLAALPATDLDFLRPELAMVRARSGRRLSRAGEPIEYVFFPHGWGHLVDDRHGGRTDGCHSRQSDARGAVGMLSVLGPSPSAATAVVRAAGTAARISASRFHAAFKPQSGDPELGPESRQGDAGYSSARLGLQCAATGRRPAWLAGYSSFATASTTTYSAHPAGAFANTRCTTNDGDALDAQSGARVGRSGLINEGRIEIDRLRLAAQRANARHHASRSRGDLLDQYARSRAVARLRS